MKEKIIIIGAFLLMIGFLVTLAIGKISFCAEKYDGFQAVACTFSPRARY